MMSGFMFRTILPTLITNTSVVGDTFSLVVYSAIVLVASLAYWSFECHIVFIARPLKVGHFLKEFTKYS